MVRGAVGLKLVFVSSALASDDKLGVLEIGAILLSVSAVVSYLLWKTGVSVARGKSIATDQDLNKNSQVTPDS